MKRNILRYFKHRSNETRLALGKQLLEEYNGDRHPVSYLAVMAHHINGQDTKINSASKPSLTMIVCTVKASLTMPGYENGLIKLNTVV